MLAKVFYQALTWGLITGFNSPFPWFYAAFFTPMILHRAYRDIQKCSAKYGEAWKEYERQVPYLFIPVSDFSAKAALWLTASSMSFEKSLWIKLHKKTEKFRAFLIGLLTFNGHILQSVS